MCNPLLAVLTAGTVGGAIYQGQSATNAAKKAAAASAASNAQMVQTAQDNTASLLAESKRASDEALTQQKEQSDQLLRQQQEQGAAMTAAANQQASAAWAAQQAILDEKAKATEAARLVGQKAKSPNVQGLIAANTKANKGGNSATLLTGPGGVVSGDLTLGKNSLLGS